MEKEIHTIFKDSKFKYLFGGVAGERNCKGFVYAYAVVSFTQF